MTLAKIGFVDHKIKCIIGVNPDERIQEQDVLIDLIVTYDVSKAIENDDVEFTCNYALMAKVITSIAQEGKYKLLETLASACIDAIHLKYQSIQHITLTVKKPQALSTAAYPFVTVDKSFV
jgi:FolB domain-containing protein